MFTREEILKAYLLLNIAYKLSEREAEIFMHLAHGKKDKEIGAMLAVPIDYDTVRTHHSNLFKKLGVHSMYSLLEIAKKLGLV